MTASHLPVAPLIAAARLDPTRWAAELSAAAGVTRRTCHRWALHGMSIWQADRAAVALGLHPLQVWGADWHADLIDIAVAA